MCGGLGGVMAAACAGAHDGGGVTVGLLPGDDRAAANEHVDVAIATGMGELRNALLARACDAMVAVGGDWGTLSEIALALKLSRPVVALESWRPQRPGLNVSGPHVAQDPAEAAALALSLATVAPSLAAPSTPETVALPHTPGRGRMSPPGQNLDSLARWR